MELLEAVEVNETYVVIKFEAQPKASTLTNAHFLVQTNEATPQEIDDPFEELILAQDYQSLSKQLNLTWQADLEPETDYTIVITGIRDAAGRLYEDHFINFTTGEEFAGPVIPPEVESFSIVDFSIVPAVYSDFIITTASLPFQISEVDPILGDFNLPADYRNGRITIMFTERPQDEYISSVYFRVQKKLIARSHSRWEDVDANISIDAQDPWVFIDLPSVDLYPAEDEPQEEVVYTTDGYEYYSENYKYRVIISKRVAS